MTQKKKASKSKSFARRKSSTVAGDLQSITLDLMKLGEPDDSGRRRPVKTGEQEDLVCDIAIAAIGQKVDPVGLEGVDLESWGTIKYEKSFATNIEGIFTGGDAARGPGIAIQAIADGKLAAGSIDQYLKGEEVTDKDAYDDFGFYIKRTDLLSKKELKNYLSDRESLPKCDMPMIDPKERVKSWDEVEKGLDLETALKEAERCLECGCQDVSECKLKKYAEMYSAECTKFKGEVEISPTDQSHPYLAHDPAKCILCGSCVRICQDLEGVSALGYTNRGFASIVQTDFNDGFKLSRCISCGACIESCPVGALTEKVTSGHQGPLKGKIVSATCLACGDECAINLEKIDDTIIKVTADKDKGLGLICKKGKFAFTEDADQTSVEAGLQEKIELCKDLDVVKSDELKSQTVFYLGSTVEDYNSVSQRVLYQGSYFLYHNQPTFLEKNAIACFENIDEILQKAEAQNGVVVVNPAALESKELQKVLATCKEKGLKAKIQLPISNSLKNCKIKPYREEA